MTWAATVPVRVSLHAHQQCERRHPGLGDFTMCQEVRLALQHGRVTTDRRKFGLSAGSYDDVIYAASGCGERVYALRPDSQDPTRWVVVTVMRPNQPSAILAKVTSTPKEETE